jgi:hypothetical protein
MIRTIAVTTRVAIRSNRKIGRPDLVAGSARLGLMMLDELRPHLSSDTAPHVREQYERARRELMKLAGESGSTGFTVGADQSRTPSSRGGGGSAPGMP